jgi:hypothetical protein
LRMWLKIAMYILDVGTPEPRKPKVEWSLSVSQ